MSYGKNLLIGIDQLINAIFGGWADETISSQAYRWEKNGIRSWPRKVIDTIFFWQKAHCRGSYVYEKERRHLPPEFRVIS
jgi:hypothetical protein